MEQVIKIKGYHVTKILGGHRYVFPVPTKRIYREVGYQFVLVHELVLVTPSVEGERDYGESVFLDNLPADSQVYLFYYPGPSINFEFENRLKEFGSQTGKNLFINIGRLNDPKYKSIVKQFQISRMPVITMTAVDMFATLKSEQLDETLFVKLDNSSLFRNPEVLIGYIAELFNLFLSGELLRAAARAKSQQRNATLREIIGKIIPSLKEFLKQINEKDIIISIFEGRFELRNKEASNSGSNSS